MKDTLKKILFYIGGPLLILLIILGLVNTKFHDIEKTLSTTSTLVQTIAILVGGFWAYRKLYWDKRAESAIKLKAMLMEYEQLFNQSAAQFRIDQSNKKDIHECWTAYALRMIPARNKFTAVVHLSCYIPKKQRKRLFDVIWLSINKGRGPQIENIDENWRSFEKEIQVMNDQLDDLVSI